MEASEWESFGPFIGDALLRIMGRERNGGLTAGAGTAI